MLVCLSLVVFNVNAINSNRLSYPVMNLYDDFEPIPIPIRITNIQLNFEGLEDVETGLQYESISWNTNVASDSIVYYKLDGVQYYPIYDSAMVRNHKVYFWAYNGQTIEYKVLSSNCNHTNFAQSSWITGVINIV